MSWAGSIAAESDWNQNNATQLARQQIPADATISGKKCTIFKSGLATLVIATESTLAILNEKKLMLSEMPMISSG